MEPTHAARGADVHASASLTWPRLPKAAYATRLKRPLDVALVLLTLPLSLPVVAVFWLAIRLGGGLGFYGQTRIGKDGRAFTCWKLRTMVPDADAALAALCDADPEIAAEWARDQKLKRDPRITPLGQLLRRTHIDEVPQLWNVLRGEMSLVGPRPFTRDQSALYGAAGGTAYYLLRPGVTGPWQVHGRGGTAFADRVTFDEWYFRSASFAIDAAILMKTVGVVLRGDGS
ncbi:MAG: sugar transferase [Pseudomonadota bacterium]